MNTGTLLVARKEAPVHDNVKQALVAASELDMRLARRALRNTERIFKNAGGERILEIERDKGHELKIDDIHARVAGGYQKVMLNGKIDASGWSCGLVAGLIYDIPTPKALVDRIISQANEIIRGRLLKFLRVNDLAALRI
jgi:NAD(P)H-dependent flavin oxidoreductase YrpB (nitropropane dioxygenase family)